MQATFAAIRSTLVAGLLLGGLPSTPASAYGITVDTGYGMEHTRLLRLNLSVDNSHHLPADYGWSWHHYWEANLSYWYLNKFKNGEEELVELGLTPNFRIERDHPWHWGRPYLEGGLGVHLLSKVHIGNRNLGSAYQFGTHAGLGIRFGTRAQWNLAWRIEHLSNAGLKEPNPGINFTMVRFGYRW